MREVLLVIGKLFCSALFILGFCLAAKAGILQLIVYLIIPFALCAVFPWDWLERKCKRFMEGFKWRNR